MRIPRYGIGLLLVALMLLPSLAEAGKLQSPPEPAPLAPEKKVTLGPTFMGSTCILGHDDLSLRVANLITPPDDRYYILLDPSQCPECVGTNRARVESASIKLYFPVPCTIQVTVGVYAAAGVDTCLTENENVQLCSAFVANLTGSEGDRVYEFTIPFPDSCQFGNKAFLGFNFFTDGPGCNTMDTRPRLVFGQSVPCPLCTIWNAFVDPPDLDLCFEDQLGLPVMYASVASCFTPTLPKSWGSVKAIYRNPQ